MTNVESIKALLKVFKTKTTGKNPSFGNMIESLS